MKNNFTGKLIKKRKNISTTGTFLIKSIQSPTEFVFGTEIDEESKQPEKQTPSKIIKEIASKKEDWSEPCSLSQMFNKTTPYID